mmetsp:Transcript_21298/g.59077  ORF Transcript_21298/g.59077 Transcript_21298/m.59077 type:complete len:227 (-) Transcript_21298:19-699(-)
MSTSSSPLKASSDALQAQPSRMAKRSVLPAELANALRVPELAKALKVAGSLAAWRSVWSSPRSACQRSGSERALQSACGTRSRERLAVKKKFESHSSALSGQGSRRKSSRRQSSYSSHLLTSVSLKRFKASTCSSCRFTDSWDSWNASCACCVCASGLKERSKSSSCSSCFLATVKVFCKATSIFLCWCLRSSSVARARAANLDESICRSLRKSSDPCLATCSMPS